MFNGSLLSGGLVANFGRLASYFQPTPVDRAELQYEKCLSLAIGNASVPHQVIGL